MPRGATPLMTLLGPNPLPGQSLAAYNVLCNQSPPYFARGLPRGSPPLSSLPCPKGIPHLLHHCLLLLKIPYQPLYLEVVPPDILQAPPLTITLTPTLPQTPL